MVSETIFSLGAVNLRVTTENKRTHSGDGVDTVIEQNCSLVVAHANEFVVLGNGSSLPEALKDALSNLYHYDYRINVLPHEIRQYLVYGDIKRLRSILTGECQHHTDPLKEIRHAVLNKPPYSEEEEFNGVKITTTVKRCIKSVACTGARIPHLFDTTVTITGRGMDESGEMVTYTLSKELDENEFRYELSPMGTPDNVARLKRSLIDLFSKKEVSDDGE